MKQVSLKNDVTKTVSLDAILPDFIHDCSEQTGWKYDVKEEIGRGGIGKVMVAFDRTVGREIALKELISSAEDGWIPSLDKMRSDEAWILQKELDLTFFFLKKYMDLCTLYEQRSR